MADVRMAYKIWSCGVLIASLLVPSVVLAEKQEEELAPGFNICQKRADEAKTTPEYRGAINECYAAASEYWESIINKKNEAYKKRYDGSPEKQQKVTNFHQAWIEYRGAEVDLVSADGGTMQITMCPYFYAVLTKRMARLLESGLLEIHEDELAPGFNICVKQAVSFKDYTDFIGALGGCLGSAQRYWETVLNDKNKSFMESYASHPSKQQCVTASQDAWIKYRDAGIDLILADGGNLQAIRALYFAAGETRRQAGTGYRGD